MRSDVGGRAGNAPAERAVEAGRHQVHAGLGQPARQQTALAPGVPPVSVAEAGVFPARVEGSALLGAREQVVGLLMEGVERLEPGPVVERPPEAVESRREAHAAADAVDLRRLPEAELRDPESGRVRVAVDRERPGLRAEVGRAEVRDRVDAHVRRHPPARMRPQPVRDAHQVGVIGLELEHLLRMAREHPP
jgi:hypothetical protein